MIMIYVGISAIILNLDFEIATSGQGRTRHEARESYRRTFPKTRKSTLKSTLAFLRILLPKRGYFIIIENCFTISASTG